MKKILNSFWRHWIPAACLIMLITGCAGANLMSKSVTSGEFQFTSAKVKWDDTAPYQLQFYGSQYAAPTPSETRAAQEYVAPLIHAFKENGSAKIGAVLAANGLPAGDGFTIFIRPQRVIKTTVGARNMVMDISIVDKSGVRAKMVMNAVGTSEAKADEILNAFANKLLAEFSSAGWMPKK